MTAPKLPVLVSNEFPGSELTGDVLEFIRAMHAYQQRYRRRYPSWSEVLYVLRTLGYAKRVPGADYSKIQIGHADDADSSADAADQKKS
jgi:hypothetical protein